jgi:hypothetical protein
MGNEKTKEPVTPPQQFQTGRTPRQLAEDVAELRGALKELQPYLESKSQSGERWPSLCVSETLAKTEQKPSCKS